MNLILKSKEGDNYEIPYSAAVHSLLIKEMIEPNETNHSNQIHLNTIPSKILKIIIEFINYFHLHGMNTEWPDMKYATIKQVAGQWYSDFIQKNYDNITDIIKYANYLMIDPLIQLSCASIAFVLKDKSVEETIEILEIEEDIDEVNLIDILYTERCEATFGADCAGDTEFR